MVERSYFINIPHNKFLTMAEKFDSGILIILFPSTRLRNYLKNGTYTSTFFFHPENFIVNLLLKSIYYIEVHYIKQ